MPTQTDKGYFLELNEFSVLAARTSSLGGPPVIEDLREAPIDSKTAVNQVIGSVFPATRKGAAQVICALRPRRRFFHLAEDDETRKYSNSAELLDSVNRAERASGNSNEIIGLQPRTGLPLNGKTEGRWFLAGTPKESLDAMEVSLRDWKLAPSRVEAATFALLGAIFAEREIDKVAAPLLVWEIGEATSDLFLIDDKGLAAAKRLTFGFNQVALSVQEEIHLKFKESAAKMFFNEFYDFSEIGAKIAARVANSLRPEVERLVTVDGTPPAALLCTGLPTKQSWFNEHLARSLDLAPWRPDMVRWCTRAGLNFIGNTLQASLSPSWLGLLGVVASYQSDKPEADTTWHPIWKLNGRAPVASNKPFSHSAAPLPRSAVSNPPTAAPTVSNAVSSAMPVASAPSIAATTPVKSPSTAASTPAMPAEATSTQVNRPVRNRAPLVAPTIATASLDLTANDKSPTSEKVSTPPTGAASPISSSSRAEIFTKPATAPKAEPLATTETSRQIPAQTASAQAKADQARADAGATIAAKARMPYATKATPKTLIGKAMAIAAEAEGSPEKPTPHSVSCSGRTPIAPAPQSPAGIATQESKLASSTGSHEQSVSTPAVREAAPPAHGDLSPTVPDVASVPQLARPLSPLEAKARAKLDAHPVRARPFLRTPAALMLVGAVVLLAGATGFFYREFAEEKAAAARAQVLAEQHAAAETEARRKAEQQARAETEARHRAEAEAAQTTAAAAAARQQAAEEARRREAETNRLLNGRGSLTIATDPVGATIEISNLAPRVSPATIQDLRLGHYAIHLTLADYEPVTLDVDIKENETAAPGPIHLVRQTGGIGLVTEPAGIDFEIRPVSAQFFATDSELRKGKTPATVNDLPTGEYIVTYSREGWPNHSQNIAVKNHAVARVLSTFSGGSVTISSTPTGASVKRNGLMLGVTPLTLDNQPPGDTRYTLEHSGFIPTSINGKIEPEKTLQLGATLEPEDRIARIVDLDERPIPVKKVEPLLTYLQDKTGGKATIALTIDRTGTPRDLKVEQASDTDIGKRCLVAAAQWRFKPGTIKGIPVKTRVSLPFNITPQ